MLMQFTNTGSLVGVDAASAPLPIAYRPQVGFSNMSVLSVAGTTQLLRVSSESNTFATPIKDLIVTYCDKACWIAKTSSSIASSSAGQQDGRIYIPAGTIGMTLPWNSQNIWIMNATTSETPTIHVAGFN
jgi:hypothetical protein